MAMTEAEMVDDIERRRGRVPVMNLRDAIREIVRGYQMSGAGEPDGWCDRDKFRENVSVMARFIYQHPDFQDSRRLLNAATGICSGFDLADTDEDRARWDAEWRSATRAVWANLGR